MKRSKITLIPFITLFTIAVLQLPLLHAGQDDSHRIHVAFALSGHIFWGIGYAYGFDAHNFIQATFFVVPEKGLPFAINAGYNYFFEGKKWRPNLGLETVIIGSPPDPDERKYLPLITFTPGISYHFDNANTVNSRLWLAYFPIKARKKFAPIGIEFKYGNSFSE